MTKNVDDLLADLGAALRFADDRFKQLTAVAAIHKAMATNAEGVLEAMAELLATSIQAGRVTDLVKFFEDFEG